MSGRVSFTFRNLSVEGDWYPGSTPGGGPDPAELTVDRLMVGGEDLPDWLHEYVVDKYYAELCDIASEIE